MTLLEKMDLIITNEEAHKMAEIMMSNPNRELTLSEITEIVFKKYFN